MRSCLPLQSRDLLHGSCSCNTGLGLTLQDDNDDWKFVGNAFKITGAVADIDDLKKVQNSNRNSFILFWGSFEKGKDQDKD